MKRFFCILMVLLTVFISPVIADEWTVNNEWLVIEELTPNPIFVDRGDWLVEAFAFLNADNPLITRFNERNGNGQDAFSPYKYGLPYIWGGSKLSGDIFKTRYVSSESNDYKFKRAYLEGFDCAGYLKFIHRMVTGEKDGLPAISKMLNRTKQHVNIDGIHPSELYKVLQIGDMFPCASKSGRHVMMYIGTLHDYGYTAEDLPFLAEYLTYPLVIHCGDNNFQREWITTFIEEANLAEYNKVKQVYPPSGGVMVSILGVPEEAATKMEPMFNGSRDVYSFDLNGYELTIYPFFTKDKLAVFRP